MSVQFHIASVFTVKTSVRQKLTLVLEYTVYLRLPKTQAKLFKWKCVDLIKRQRKLKRATEN